MSVSENATSILVQIARCGSGSGAASVQVSTIDEIAIAGSDFAAVATTVAWADGELGVRTVAVPLIQDAVHEQQEFFSLTMGSLVNATTSRAITSINIMDDDANPAGVLTLIGDRQRPYDPQRIRISEASGVAHISVERSGGSSGAVTAVLQLNDYSAIAGNDYELPTDLTLTWNDGESGAKTLDIILLDDHFANSSRYFSVYLDQTGSASNGGTGVVVDILDDDPAPAGVLAVPDGLVVNEGAGNAVFTVHRVGGAQGNVSVAFTTQGGSAAAGSDFQSTSGVLMWDDGDDTPRTITIPLIADGLPERQESFDVAFNAPTGGLLLPVESFYVSCLIQDQDATAGVISFASEAVFFDEDAGMAVVSVLRMDGASGAITVPYATSDGMAVSPTDYTSTTGVLSWADGDSTAKTIAIPITDNQMIDGQRYFDLELGAPTGGALLLIDPLSYRTYMAVLIIDDDVPATGIITLDRNQLVVREGDGVATCTVQRVGGSNGTVSLLYRIVPQSARASFDYVAPSSDYAESAYGSLTWDDGDASDRIITIPLIDDGVAEGAETLVLSLVIPSGGASIGTSAIQVTILDDDAAPAGHLRFTSPRITVASDAGYARFTVERHGGSAGAVSITCATEAPMAIDGYWTDAREDLDYIGTLTTLSWADGQVGERSFLVPIIDHDRALSDRRFAVALSNPTGGAVLDDTLSAAIAACTITSRATPVGGILALPERVTTTENTSVLLVPVTRNGGSSGSLTVAYTTIDGTARAGTDFTAARGTLRWADGDAAAQNIAIDLVDDALGEGDETFSIFLYWVTGDGVITGNGTIVTVHDDESKPAGELGFVAASIASAETDGLARIEVSRLGGSTGVVSVRYDLYDAARGPSATCGLDYSPTNSGVLTWNDGETANQTIVIPLIADGLGESTESFDLALHTPQGGATLGRARSTVAISDVREHNDNSDNNNRCGIGSISAWSLLLSLALLARLRPMRRQLQDAW